MGIARVGEEVEINLVRVDLFFFFQAEDGIRDIGVTGVQTCALPILTAVEIIASGTRGIAPATFEFEADVIGGTGPYIYRWVFDVGSVEVDDDETVEHTFDVAGSYNVGLTVTDSTGRNAFDSILIIVEPPPPLTAVEI